MRRHSWRDTLTVSLVSLNGATWADSEPQEFWWAFWPLQRYSATPIHTPFQPLPSLTSFQASLIPLTCLRLLLHFPRPGEGKIMRIVRNIHQRISAIVELLLHFDEEFHAIVFNNMLQRNALRWTALSLSIIHPQLERQPVPNHHSVDPLSCTSSPFPHCLFWENLDEIEFFCVCFP